MLMLLPIAALLFAGCTTDVSVLAATCDITLDSVEPQQGLPGDTVVLTGTPLTTRFDTAVYVGSTRATVLSLDRDDCDDCDDCRSDNLCNDCSDCDDCDLLCHTDCVETIRVQVPAAPAGPTTIALFNSHGTSTVLDFTVLGDTGDDTAADDTATDDTATDDTSADTATDDTSANDTSADAAR